MIERLGDRAMATLWTRMGQIYGHRWFSAYGEYAQADGRATNTVETWRKGLAGITPEQVAAGLEACLAQGAEWPPTLPEFRKLCKPTAAPYHQAFPKALPASPSDPAVAEDAITKMRRSVGRMA